MFRVTMPRLDPGMQSGKILEWLRKEGDHVEKDTPIASVEGEKTTFEVNAPGAGVVRRLLFEAGMDFYARHQDKDWSLTDCISFLVMEQCGAEDALTEDHHFAQAGFRALLK